MDRTTLAVSILASLAFWFLLAHVIFWLVR